MPSLGWEGPILLWQGSPQEAVECPDRASQRVYEGLGDLRTTVQNPCATCECGSPSCELPTGVIASDGLTCEGPTSTLFSAPDAWTGSCISRTPIESVGSVFYMPVTVNGCEPVTTPAPGGTAFEWQKLARACQSSEPIKACDDATKLCVPASEAPPSGFSQCVFKEGEHPPSECPSSYPAQHVYYQSFEDRTSCSPCTCGNPTGSQCSAVVHLFKDAVCSASEQIDKNEVFTAAGVCQKLTEPGVPLTSMRADFNNHPGTCAPRGGQVIGEATPTEPSTFCCIE